MRSLRRTYWYISAFLSKHAKTMVFAIVGGIVLFAFILPLLNSLPQIKKTRYVGVIGSYDLSSMPLFIQEQISRGLTTADTDGTVIPDLVERWSIEDDGKTYRFILKQGVKWQDGKELIPSDINYNFQDTQIVTTENEIIFKLKDPFSPFPQVVSQPLFREIESGNIRFFTKKKIIGLGKYRINKIRYQDNILSELILESISERIVYRFYLTDQRAEVAYKLGKVDEIIDLSSPRTFKDWPNTELEEVLHTDQYLAVFFNLNDPLFPKNIRQALAYGVNKGADDIRAKGPINPESWAYLEGVKSYDYDRERAVTRLLDEVPKTPLNFSLSTTPRFQSEAEVIKSQWEELGDVAVDACQKSSAIKEKADCANLDIQVNVTVSNYPDTTSFQAMLIGQQIPPDPDQYSLWHSTQNTNFMSYKNPRIDALLENGRKETDQQARKAIYQEFQQFLLEDSPAIFFRYLFSYNVKRT